MITIKIGIFSQIVITPTRISIILSDDDYRNYYEDIYEYVHILKNYFEDAYQLSGDYRLVGSKIATNEFNLVYKFINQGKLLDTVNVPLDMGYGAVSSANKNISLNRSEFIITLENGKTHICYPTQHAINQFILRYCYVAEIPTFNSISGIMNTMKEVFKQCKITNNAILKNRNKKYKSKCYYLRYRSSYLMKGFHSLGFVVDSQTFDIITFEMIGADGYMNKVITERNLTCQ